MKKLISVLMIFVLLLSACSSSDGGDDTVVVWAMGEEGNKLGDFAQGFTDETGINVEVVAIPWDQANEKVTTAIASGEGPDVLQVGNTNMVQFAEAGALADLTPYADTLDNFNLDLYFDGASETSIYNDTQYAVPWYVDTRLLYYRTDIIDEFCGEVPATQTDLLDCATTLGERGEDMYGLDIDINDQVTTPNFAWGNGFEFKDSEGNWNFEDQTYIDALQLLSDFGTSGATFYDSGLDITNTFIDGTVPMFMSGPWMVSILNDVSPESSDLWSIATMPAGTEGFSTTQGGTNWTLFESSENKDNGAEFINWMMSSENQDSWYQTVNALPARQDVWEMDSYVNDQYLSVWKEQLEVATPVPADANWDAVSKEMVSQQQAVTLSDTTPEEAATIIQEYAESLE